MLTADYDWKDCMCAHFIGALAYRVKPKPVVEVVTLYGDGLMFDDIPDDLCTHKFTYNRVGGEIDCSSAVMVKL